MEPLWRLYGQDTIPRRARSRRAARRRAVPKLVLSKNENLGATEENLEISKDLGENKK